jgi:hypothetical protein
MRRVGLGVPFVLTMLTVVAPARPGHAGKAASGQPSVKETLVANEKGAFEAFKQRNASTFNDYLAEDFLGVDAGGVTRKADQADAMRDSELKDYALDDIKLVKATKNVVILTYKLTQHGTYKGEAIPAKVHATSVWAKRGDKWVAVLHQETPARAAPSH